MKNAGKKAAAAVFAVLLFIGAAVGTLAGQAQDVRRAQFPADNLPDASLTGAPASDSRPETTAFSPADEPSAPEIPSEEPEIETSPAVESPSSSDSPTGESQTTGPSPAVADPTTTVETPTPSTDTPVPSTDTPTPSTDTPVPSTDTPTPSTDTPTPSTDTPTPSTGTPDAPENEVVRDRDFVLTVFDITLGQVVETTLDRYILRAMAAEMAAESPSEALAAQAVAIRSYILSKAKVVYPAHHGAMTCNDMMHCMTCVSEETYASLSPAFRRAYENAQAQTDGIVLLYGGAVATTNFHSCSYFYTASAKEVYGVEVPYLQAVPTGVYNRIYNEYSFSSRALLSDLLGIPEDELGQLSGAPFGRIAESDSGRVASVTLYGCTFEGRLFRERLGFPSTTFEVSYSPENDLFVFHVYGSGHGVGMSQSGAKRMAADGKNFHEILSHYYLGTTEAVVDRELLKIILPSSAKHSANLSERERDAAVGDQDRQSASVPHAGQLPVTREQVSNPPQCADVEKDRRRGERQEDQRKKTQRHRKRTAQQIQ